jgi:flagellin
VQASNDAYSNADRNQMNIEFSNLLDEFDTQAERTTWNGIDLLSSSNGSFSLQIGKDNSSGSEPTIDLTLFRSRLNQVGTVTGTLETTQSNGIGTLSVAQLGMADLDDALDNLNTQIALASSIQNRLEIALDNNHSYSEHITTSAGRISDADIAEESATAVKHQILFQSGTSVMNKIKEIAGAALSLL